MSNLVDFWKWFSTPENLKAISVIGGVIAALALGIWTVYTHFYKRSEPGHNQTISGIYAGRDIIAGRDVINFNIPKEFLEKRLREIETNILAQMPKADPARQAVLERELKIVREKSANLEKTKKELEARLAEASRALDDFKKELPAQQIDTAKQALTRGDTKAAEALFKRTLEKSKEHTAEAAFQLGILAESRIDYQAAKCNDISR